MLDWTTALASLAAFAAVMLLTPLNIMLSRRTGLLDKPHPGSVHDKPVPLAGGLAIGIPVLALQTLYWRLGAEASHDLAVLVGGGAAVLLVGYLDDRLRLGAFTKLSMQIAVVLTVCLLGFRIEVLSNPFGGGIELGWLSVPVSLVWFLLVMNSFNLVDGLDGLAAGIAVIVCLVLAVAGLVFSNQPVVFLSLALAAACLAFLRYNFPPARIFMGDTGSLFIGFNIAAISITGAGQMKGIAAMTLLIPITTLFIPLFDTLLAVLRRMRQRRHIFRGDQQHLHHRLLQFGFTQRSVVLIAWFVTLLFGLIAVGFTLATQTLMTVLLLLLAVLLMIVFYILQRWLRTMPGKLERNDK
ncbi:MAG: undecaprenyl/decaprenyl-phosphate alpha-N-acetylglucosaminyl 1-phosphate transferase [Candidatus Cloacimonetes bacterium]|nr:undecaprenyl/decaprenyl-phosphate alpha-N-acetylglucosaminyl 1-phosphate transferase [Candidatus Cloacimonadota bacterium]